MTEAAATPAGRMPPGHRVGDRYAIIGTLGEGGSGTVYLAQDLTDTAASAAEHRRVVLKVIHRHLCGDRQIYGRFRREAAILERLESDHVVRLLDVLEEDELPVLVLEHAGGRSLEDFLRERAPIALDLAVEILLQVCAGLGAAHAANVVHRDLKPANVLVSLSASSPEGIHVRILDFGLAKIVHGDKMVTGLTEHDMIFGTPEYMAPEQARGDEVDARCDLYAAGVILYELTTGTVPFCGRTPIASMTAHLTETPLPPRISRPEISPALEAVILRALAKAKEDRYASARAFAEALAATRAPAPVIVTCSPNTLSAGLADTDLHIDAPSKAHAMTLPSAGELEPVARAGAGPAQVLEEAVAPTKRAPLSRSMRGGLGLWIAVAVMAVLVGVVMGVLVGVR